MLSRASFLRASSLLRVGALITTRSRPSPSILHSLNFASKRKSRKDVDSDDITPIPPKHKSSSNLDDAIKQIEQAFGKGSIMKLGTAAASTPPPVEVISTGSLTLDVALGVGGVPLGRVTEIFGPESSGKTTLALHIIAEAQRQGRQCTFIDAEHALNPQWAARLGVRLDELLISQPDSGEQALEIADSLIRSGTQGVVVIDSVSALVPRQELEGEMGDAHMGLQARLMSQALRKLTPYLVKSNTALIFINQIRMKLGVMFGSPETTSGGQALKFYSSVRLDIRRAGTIKRGEDVVGSQVKVKVAKNKMAPPFREALFDIDYGKGISKSGELLDLGVRASVLDKSGIYRDDGAVMSPDDECRQRPANVQKRKTKASHQSHPVSTSYR
eukprot:TRINITY_DN9342_c0_g1_i3.p1 TRINITY_DN9342_c0_g1~~TRINITY_DN9342_c0_g1_i3.p1  ORF type:complete len:387 (+),score=70.38 TRINITY_DN9342_c0_g1_i3:91-1251(+)